MPFFGFGKGNNNAQPAVVVQAQDGPVQAEATSYNGIGAPPSGEAYNGIGAPPAPQAVNQSNISLQSQQPAVVQSTQFPQGQQEQPQTDISSRAQLDVMTHLTQRANKAMFIADKKAKELKNQYIDSEHLLFGLLSDVQVYKLLADMKIQPQLLESELNNIYKKEQANTPPQIAPRVKSIIETSLGIAREMGFEFISPEHILVAIAEEGEGMGAQILAKLGVQKEELRKKVTGSKEAKKEEEKKKTALEQFTVDLTAKAQAGKIDPITERSAEIERVIHILSRRMKNNPCIIGEPGTGKTALVEGLAQKIVAKQVPEALLNKKILVLDMTNVLAGASHKGEFEERMKNIVEELKQAKDTVILFIDEVHTIVGAGGNGEGMDASNFLKPALSRAEIQIIGATTIAEYRRYIEKDPALERRFQVVQVDEPSEEAAIKMIKGVRDKFEAFHKVKIPDETIEAAVKLSKRYIGDRFLPDKAFDLIDEAAASVKLPLLSLPEEIKSLEDRIAQLQQEVKEDEQRGERVKAKSVQAKIDEIKGKLADKQQEYVMKKAQTTTLVTIEAVRDIIAKRTGISISKISTSETEKLAKLEDIMHQRLIGQEKAVSVVAQAVRRGRAGLKAPGRPIGSFVFAGPSGVGKTELAKTLADVLFGDETAIHRFDMTEFMEKHEVAKLLGPPPGYVGYEEGGKLTEAVRRKPYSIVLFDEVEKAHPDIFNILLQILDDGRLTDNKGRVVSFKDTVVICTSNIGSKIIQEELMGTMTDKKDQADALEFKAYKTYLQINRDTEMFTKGSTVYLRGVKEGKKVWEQGTVMDYFSDHKVEPDSFKLPTDFDTQCIGPGSVEMISKSDVLYIRNPQSPKVWKVTPLSDYFNGQTVSNGNPQDTSTQLPVERWDTHAFVGGFEVITYKDRFWKRRINSNVWETNYLKVYMGKPPQDRPSEVSVVAWHSHTGLLDGTEVILIDDKVYSRKGGAPWQIVDVAEYFGKEAPFVSAEVRSAEVKVESADDAQYVKLKEKVMGELLKFFRPELVNRFDEVIVFEPLQFKHMAKIVKISLKNLSKLMLDQEIGFSYTDEAVKQIAVEGFDPLFGARPLRRAIQKMVENPISELIIAGKVKPGDTVIADKGKDDSLSFMVERVVIEDAPADSGVDLSGQEGKNKVAVLKKFMCETTSKIFETEVKPWATTISPYCGSKKVHEIVEQ